MRQEVNNCMSRYISPERVSVPENVFFFLSFTPGL